MPRPRKSTDTPGAGEGSPGGGAAAAAAAASSGGSKKRKRANSSGDGNSKSARTHNPPSKELKAAMLKVYDVVYNEVDSEDRWIAEMFMVKPSPEDYPEYANIIHKPMDMETIEARIKSGAYSTMPQMVADFDLMFNNALLFNAEHSWVWEDAKHLKELVHKTVAKLGYSGIDKALARLLDAVYYYQDAGGFNIYQPFVELPTREELPVYYDYISDPIDLNTIEKKRRANVYTTPQALLADLTLMFENAMAFNEEGSDIYNDAKTLLSEVNRTARNMKIPKGSGSLKVKIPIGAAASSSAAAGGGAAAMDTGGDHHSSLKISLNIGGGDGSEPATPGTQPHTPAAAAGAAATGSAGKQKKKRIAKVFGGERPPPVPSTKDLCQQVLDSVKAYVDVAGRNLSTAFQHMPERSAHPEFHQRFTSPVDIDTIQRRVMRYKYTDIDDLMKDIVCCFENFKQWHGPGTQEHEDAAFLLGVAEQSAEDHKAVLTTAQRNRKRWLRKKAKDSANAEAAAAAEAIIIDEDEDMDLQAASADAALPASFVFNGSGNSDKYMLAHELATYFGCRLQRIFKTYPGLWRRSISDDEREDLIQRGVLDEAVASSLSQESLLVVNSQQVSDILAGRTDRYKREPMANMATRSYQKPNLPPELEEDTSFGSSSKDAFDGSNHAAKRMTCAGQQLYQRVYDHLGQLRRQLGVDLQPFMRASKTKDKFDILRSGGRPVDLNSVQHRIKSGAYADAHYFMQDLLAVFKNAQMLNPMNSKIHTDATRILSGMASFARQTLPFQTILSLPILWPTQPPLVSIMRRLIDIVREDESKCQVFLTLPDEKEFPSYYEIISRPMSIYHIVENIELGHYHRLDQFQDDVFLLFSNARQYNVIGSEVWQDAVDLQKKYIKALAGMAVGLKITSPALDYKDENLAADLEEERIAAESSMAQDGGDESKRQYADELEGPGGDVFHVGDYVYVENSANKDTPPHIVLIKRLWTAEDGIKWFEAQYFFRPDETFHVATRTFFKNEVLRSNDQYNHLVESICGRCYVSFHRDFVKSEPKGIAPEHHFICESRYNTKAKSIQRIKSWQGPARVPEMVSREPPLDLRSIPRVKSVFADVPEDESVLLAKHDVRNIHLKESEDTESREDGCLYFKLYHLDDRPIQIGDFVEVFSHEWLPYICRVQRMWTDSNNKPWFRGLWYLRPLEVPQEDTDKFYRNELIESTITDVNSMNSIITHCAVLNPEDYKHVVPLDVLEEHVFICDSVLKADPEGIVVGEALKSTVPDGLPGAEFKLRDSPRSLAKSPSPLLLFKQKEEERKKRELLQEQLNLQRLDGEPLRHMSSEKAVATNVDPAYEAFCRIMREMLKYTMPSGEYGRIDNILPARWTMASAQEKQYYATLAARSGLLEGSLSASDVYTPPELQTPLHQIVGPYWQCRSGVCVKRYPTKDALLDHFLAEHAHTSIDICCHWNGCSRDGKRPFVSKYTLTKHFMDRHYMSARVEPNAGKAAVVTSKASGAATSTSGMSFGAEIAATLSDVVEEEAKRNPSALTYSKDFLDYVKHGVLELQSSELKAEADFERFKTAAATAKSKAARRRRANPYLAQAENALVQSMPVDPPMLASGALEGTLLQLNDMLTEESRVLNSLLGLGGAE